MITNNYLIIRILNNSIYRKVGNEVYGLANNIKLLYDYIKKLSLVCKEWNRIIIPKITIKIKCSEADIKYIEYLSKTGVNLKIKLPSYRGFTNDIINYVKHLTNYRYNIQENNMELFKEFLKRNNTFKTFSITSTFGSSVSDQFFNEIDSVECNFEKVKTLKLYNNFSDDNIKMFLDRFKNIKKIILSGNISTFKTIDFKNITKIHLEVKENECVFDVIENCKSLKELNILNSSTKYKLGELLKHLENNQNIEVIFSDILFDTLNVSELVQFLNSNKKIRELTLGVNILEIDIDLNSISINNTTMEKLGLTNYSDKQFIFLLLERWSTPTNIKEFTNFGVTLTQKTFNLLIEKVPKLEIIITSSFTPETYEYLESLVKLNSKYLKCILKTTSKRDVPVENYFTDLQYNNHITLLYIDDVWNFNQFILFIKSNHPSITKLWTSLDEFDSSVFTKAINSNLTLSYLRLNIKNEIAFDDIFESLIEIIDNNRIQFLEIIVDDFTSNEVILKESQKFRLEQALSNITSIFHISIQFKGNEEIQSIIDKYIVGVKKTW